MNALLRRALALAGTLLLATAAAGATRWQADLEQGDRRAGSGDLPGALASYLAAYEMAGAGDDLARLDPTLLERLADIAGRHEPAARAVAGLRATARDGLADGTGGWRRASELAALDDALGRRSDTVATFLELATAGRVRDDARQVLFNVVFPDLVERREYRAVVEAVPDPVGRLESRVELYFKTAMILAPALAGADGAERHDELRNRVLEEGARLYEAFTGAGRDEEASQVADLLVAFDGSVQTQALLDVCTLRSQR